MAPVEHRRTSEYIAEPYRKRRKASTQFNTLPIPTDEIGNLLDVENPFPLRLIPKTGSLEWGPFEMASARACVEPQVTSKNEQLIRTYHPALCHLTSVGVYTEVNGKIFWAVFPEAEDCAYGTYAAGREIHAVPSFQQPPLLTQDYLSRPFDPVMGHIDTRKFLCPTILDFIRETFPASMGAMVLISGYIIILFRTAEEMKNSWESGPSTIGRLTVGFNVAKYNSTVGGIRCYGLAPYSGTGCLDNDAKWNSL